MGDKRLTEEGNFAAGDLEYSQFALSATPFSSINEQKIQQSWNVKFASTKKHQECPIRKRIFQQNSSKGDVHDKAHPPTQ